MEQTVVEQTNPPAPNGRGQYKRKRSEALIARDVAIYERYQAGLSVRAICDEFGIKSTQTVHAGIQRGKQIVLERGIDIDERRISIDQLFANTLGHLAGEVARQADEGRIQTIERSDGSREIRRTKGIDPRTAEALARSADRWAQFLGLTDRAQEVNQQATVINLAPPADAAAFEQQWTGAAETVDVTASECKSECNDRVLAADSSAALERPTAHKAVEAPDRAQGELF